MATLARVWRSFSLSRGALALSQRALITTDARPPTQLVKTEEKSESVEKVTPEELVKLESLSGIPDNQVNRLAKIFMPTRNTMQSGSHNTHHWQMEFDNQERWENTLMGWTSSGDPHSNTVLTFRNKEEAIAFAVKNGYKYEIVEPKKPKMKVKTYGENFSWNKKTRVSTK